MMSIGYKLFSLLVIIVGSTLTISAAQGLEQLCRLVSGGRGVCRRITQCPEVAQFAHRREVKYCGTLGRLAIVCCPLDSTSCSSTGNNDGVAAPVVNFECGRQAKRILLPFGAPLSRRRRQSLFGRSIDVGPPVFVIGAITSQISAWPWMALLGELDINKTPDWFCAGSLINEQWILTAAHCLNFRTPSIIRLGEHDYNDPNDTEHEDYGISQTVVYPHYVPEQAYHDLALIKLSKKVQIKDFIRPVCLPWNQRNPSFLVNSEVTVTGWGRTKPGGHKSPALQEVQVKVFPSSTCHAQYKKLVSFNRVWPSGIGEETMCAGTTAGGKDACQGDSGGPAVHFECSRYTLAGVISKGFGCGLRDYAGVYVNIRQLFYLQWIKQTAF